MEKKVIEYEGRRIRFDTEAEREAKILEMESEGWTCMQKYRVLDEATNEYQYVMMVVLIDND